MAKILIVVDAPHWTGMNVAKGIQRYSKHEVDICFWWFKNKHNDYDPRDYDLCYIHSGGVINRKRLEEIKPMQNELKWIMGFRGATATHRQSKYFDEIWDAYAVAGKHLLQYVPEPKYVCYTGVDTEMFHPLPFPEKFKIGWAGTAHAGPKKFQHVVALPFDKILAGPARKTDPWYKLGVRGRKHVEMPDFYSQCSVYVCTSEREGSPAPPREAAAMGRPVISTKAGDLVEWMPDWALVDHWEKMIPKINKLKKDRELLEWYGKQFRNLSLQWDFKNVVPDYDRMFDEVLG